MEIKEWQINIPSGQCPFSDWPYNYTKNKTEPVCNIARINNVTDTICSEENCPLKISEPKLFQGIFLADVEGWENDEKKS